MSVGSGFDPSREWLGIDAVDLADPFRALGLAATESDPDIVNAAAERLLARLGGVAPGPFRLAHDSLRRRIEACREEVLAVVAARPRPAAAAASGFVPPPPPGLAAAGAGGIPTGAVPATPWTPPPVPPPMPSAEPTAPGPLPDAEAAGPSVIELRRSARRARGPTDATPALVSLLAVIAAGVAAYMLWPYLADAARGPRQVARGSRAVSSPAAAVPRPKVPAPAQDPEPAFDREERPRARPVDAEPDRPRRPPLPRPVPPVEPGTAPESERPEPRPSEPTPSGPPTPVSAPPQPSREQRARAAAAVQQALEEAYASLRQGKFEAADRQVAAAARLAEPFDGFDDRVTAWRQLAVYARQAAALRDRALGEASGDYDVGRTRIAVIESTPDVFKYRVRGETRRVPPADIPTPVVTAIMRAWFRADDQPGNHVFLGVHLLLGKPPVPPVARAEWDRARQRGEDVANLEPLLDDPIIRAAAQEPVPGRDQ